MHPIHLFIGMTTWDDAEFVKRSVPTLQRLNREIRRRTRVVGCFPDGRSAVMLVTARLRYLASKDWGTKRYLNMDRLWDAIT